MKATFSTMPFEVDGVYRFMRRGKLMDWVCTFIDEYAIYFYHIQTDTRISVISQNLTTYDFPVERVYPDSDIQPEVTVTSPDIYYDEDERCHTCRISYSIMQPNIHPNLLIKI